MHLFSNALRQTVTFAFVIPEPPFAGPGPYPALLQLHGGNDDYLSWPTRSKLRVHVEHLPLIAIMPNGGMTAWSDWVNPQMPVETFLVKELIPACESILPIREGRWAVGGNSMGGYGSIHLGLKHPDRFASIYAHSSVIYGHGVRDLPPGLSLEDYASDDPYVLAGRRVDEGCCPVLGMDCGTDDRLREEGRAFHQHLEEIRYPHRFHVVPGGHDWYFWDERFPVAVRQHLEVFAGE
jgi:S-formylglutathione hydrolase FrmB